MCVYVCIHTYTHAYMYVCIFIYVHDSIYICMQMYVYRGTISTDIYWNLFFFK